MFLGKEDFALSALRGPPVAKSPLQRAQRAVTVDARMPALKLFKQRDPAQLRAGLQERQELRRPDVFERILARAPVAKGTLRRQRVERVDAASATLTDARLRRGTRL